MFWKISHKIKPENKLKIKLNTIAYRLICLQVKMNFRINLQSTNKYSFGLHFTIKILDNSTKLTFFMIRLSVRSTNNAPLFDYFQIKVVMPVIPDGCLIPYIKHNKYDYTKLISSFVNCVRNIKNIYMGPTKKIFF